MSYGFTTSDPIAAADLESTLRDALDTVDATAPLSTEAREQGLAAISCVRDLVQSGALGDAPVHVRVSGHANPGHAATPGWANDSLTISIYQA